MKKFLPTMCALAAAVSLSVAAGCVTETTKTGSTLPNTNGANTNGTNTNGAGVGAAPSPQTAQKKEAASGSPVTLPVLDALFAEESFAGELKSKLQLTDEQVEQVRKVAREETGGLEEKEGEEHAGTTTEAAGRAAEKIRAVVGAEKSEQLMAFARERWAGGDAAASSAAPARPNSVPNDTRIVVNIPAYRMDAFENGQLVKSYKIGIGYPEFPLPTGERKASTIIFNPTWTPPDEPWVKGQFKPGQKVEAGSRANPLGVIKIPIGQPSLIHGGKSPARLGAFASHGCVGLTNPQVQDFSVVLAKMGGAGLTKEQVDAYAKRREETKNLKLSSEVPVELRYETIVVHDGRLHIYRDVYDRGTNTEENLRRVLEAHGVSLDQFSEQERAAVSEALQQMARDASGRPATGAGATPTPTPGRKSSGPVRETKSIKGRKESVIEVAALKGKGYPAPTPGSGFDAPKQAPQQQRQKAAQPRQQPART